MSFYGQFDRYVQKLRLVNKLSVEWDDVDY